MSACIAAVEGLYSSFSLQHSLQQKGCCRGLYTTHSLSHGPISIQQLYSSYTRSTLYSYTAAIQYTSSTASLWGGGVRTVNTSERGFTYSTLQDTSGTRPRQRGVFTRSTQVPPRPLHVKKCLYKQERLPLWPQWGDDGSSSRICTIP